MPKQKVEEIEIPLTPSHEEVDETDNEDSSSIEIKPKKERKPFEFTDKRREAFEKAKKKRDENREMRKKEKEEQEKQHKMKVEEKIVKKANKLKRNRKRKKR